MKEVIYYLKNNTHISADVEESELDRFTVDFSKPWKLYHNSKVKYIIAPNQISAIEIRDKDDTNTGTDGK